MSHTTYLAKFTDTDAAIRNALDTHLAGGKRWIKGDHDRIYFNNIPYIKTIYLDCKTGVLHAFATYDGLRTKKWVTWYGVVVDQIRGMRNKDLENAECENPVECDFIKH